MFMSPTPKFICDDSTKKWGPREVMRMRRGYESAALMNGDSALVRVLGTLLLCALHHVRVREGGTLHPRRDRTRTQPCCRPDFEILSPQGCVTQTSVVYKPLSLQSFVLQQLKNFRSLTSAHYPMVEVVPCLVIQIRGWLWWRFREALHSEVSISHSYF